MSRPLVLSIAGFDPSGGAGVLADCKTFEQFKVQGFGVLTSNTIQNDRDFDQVHWIEQEIILEQLHTVCRHEAPAVAKIGLIQSLDVLTKIVTALKALNTSIKIIWDPVLQASAGFSFHHNMKGEELRFVLGQLDLCTPNLPEYEKLERWLQDKPEHCTKTLLKGGHGAGQDAVDFLLDKEDRYPFQHERLEGSKHGTGCILSAAITAQLALGADLSRAISEAKTYTTSCIQSNASLLSYHKQSA